MCSGCPNVIQGLDKQGKEITGGNSKKYRYLNFSANLIFKQLQIRMLLCFLKSDWLPILKIICMLQ